MNFTYHSSSPAHRCDRKLHILLERFDVDSPQELPLHGQGLTS
ncbi:MAG: hypothetical protein ACFCU8_08695 [Thermosynechococcaceae cyanobacterium]